MERMNVMIDTDTPLPIAMYRGGNLYSISYFAVSRY